MHKDYKKVLGSLMGVAIGDALGGPLEFMTAEAIQTRHGTVREMIGGGWLNLAPGEITDDTQMTLCVAEGIVKNPQYPFVEIGKRFVEWYDSNPKDIGNCCRAVIADVKSQECDVLTCWLNSANQYHKQTGGQSAGNGALMRATYPALFYGIEPFADWREPKRYTLSNINDIIGLMTHRHEASRAAVYAYSKFIAYATLEGEVKFTLDESADIIQPFITNLQPDGYAPNSLMCAIKAVQKTFSFEDALIKAVNQGGDADTIGAITGGLAGAIYGIDAIPKRWLDKIMQSNEMCLRISELAEIASENTIRLDYRLIEEMALFPTSEVI